MKQRVLAILLIALVIAAGGTYFVYRMVSGRMSSGKPVEVARIFVAARNLEAGTLLREADLVPGGWTGAPVKGMIADKKAALGRGVISTIYEGEPILDNRLAQAGAGAGLAAIIPAGMRACAVKVNDVVGVAGFVLPGARVDVLISGNPPTADAAAGPKVKTLLQNIEVLSAGQNIQRDTDGKPVQVQVVNLLVTPEQAEILSLASNETRIQLVLRNPLDTKTVSVPGTVMATLFSGGDAPPGSVKKQHSASGPKPAPAAAPAVRPPLDVFLVEVLNGSRRTEVRFTPSPEVRP